jgi:plastocyanin
MKIMVSTQQQRSPFSIGMIAFVIGIVVSITYYQFYYLPEINKKPVIPQEILNPLKIAEVKMIPGSSNPQQADNFIPKLVEVELAVNNKVTWINDDGIGHTVTTDNNAIDLYSGRFDSLETIGTVPPGGTYEFLFTQPGEFPYHCEPHPWMKGTIKVLKQKF